MKRYNVVLILCILLFFCSCGEKNEDIQGNNGTLSIFIEDYELQIPCDWMIKSVYSYQKADQPVLQVDVLDFDEEQLKQEYGYQSKKNVWCILCQTVYMSRSGKKQRQQIT